MTTADEEMEACAADLTTCVAPCTVIQYILRQCPNNKDDHSEDDYDEDDHNKTCWTPATEEVRICVSKVNDSRD